jgi:hypothetical protein
MTDHTIPGEFTRIVVAQPDPTQPTNPIALAHAAMVGAIARVVCPQLDVSPQPEEFEDVADYLIRVAQAMDIWLTEIGEIAQSNATCKLDKKCFTGIFEAAVDGFATFELDREAEVLRENEAEYRQAARQHRTMGAVVGMLRGERGL